MEDQVEQDAGEPTEGGSAAGFPPAMLRLLPFVGAVLVAAGVGYGLSRLFPASAAGRATSEERSASAPGPGKSSADEEFIYYTFEPDEKKVVVVNLNVRRPVRYIRVDLVLAIRPDDFDVAEELLDKKKPELKSWLINYLSGQTLEDVTGPKNQNRIQREILDAFNEKLRPDKKPLIHHILFNQWAVQ